MMASYIPLSFCFCFKLLSRMVPIGLYSGHSLGHLHELHDA